ncbi:MAG: prepilin-type N-terminal cleavage/methylation domain-containing protein [Phycisphaerales bacterium]
MSTNTKVKKCGFTLIELLVVIAIIALLLSIIVPGLKKAKDHARKTMCMSGIRQLTVAFGLYQEDNDQKFPSANIAGLSDDQNAITTYSKWGGNRGMEQGYESDERLLNPYIGVNNRVQYGTTKSEAALGVYFCPSDRGGYGGAWGNAGGKDRLPTLHYWLGYSYNYNTDGLSSSAKYGLWGKKLSNVRSPVSVILVSDGSMAPYAYGSDPCFQYRYWHHEKELGWGNAAFVDGHVNFFRVSDSPNKPNRDWWKGSNWTFRVE